MKTTIKTLLLLAVATSLTLTSFAHKSNNTLSNYFVKIEINDSLENEKVKTANSNNEEKLEVLFKAEKMPEFNGGTKALVKYLKKNVNYPQVIRESEIEDKIYVQFVVNPDGSLSDISALTGKNKTLKQEAVNVVSEMPNWTPAVDKGVNVPVRLILPISFVLK
ncbi:MAG: energy transducer TonB [Bacteroidia bacterium]